MLNLKEAVATIPVKSVEVAKNFYGDTLGLTPLPVHEKGVLAYRTGASRLFVYESQFAGTNKATAVTWVVGDDLEAIVKALKAKGVPFEHYDFPGTRREGDIHVAGNIKVAWCKDPDGNILSLVTD
jgi:catechol 2,3-dioxygenase-like lactoylglutathione lyase family enzyme